MKIKYLNWRFQLETHNRMFRSKPVHDWSSHACDAMRYLAVGLQELNTRQTAPQSVADNNYRII